jgi:hypothetical protein
MDWDSIQAQRVLTAAVLSSCVMWKISKGSIYRTVALLSTPTSQDLHVNVLPHPLGPAMAVGFLKPLDIGGVEIQGHLSKGVIGADWHH